MGFDLSIIIAASRSTEIERSLDSLRNQTVKEAFEVIVVGDSDCCGTDNKWPFTVRFIECEVKHPGTRRNIGCKASTGGYLFFIDDDAFATSEWLECGLRELRDNNQPIVAGVEWEPSDNPRKQASDFIYQSPFTEGVLNWNVTEARSVGIFDIFLSNCAMWRSVWETVGGFNEKAPYTVDDTEFFYIAKQLGYEIRKVPEMAVHHKRRTFPIEFLQYKFRTRFSTGTNAVLFPEIYFRSASIWIITVSYPLAALLLTTCFKQTLAALLYLYPAFLVITSLSAIRLGWRAWIWVPFGTAATQLSVWVGFFIGILKGLVTYRNFANVRKLKKERYKTCAKVKVSRFPVRVPIIFNLLLSVMSRAIRCVPNTLVFFVMDKCNGHCEFCIYRDKISAGHRIQDKQRLSLEEIRRVALNMRGLPRLALSGGEPFLCETLVDICSSFVQQAKVKIIDLPTNGIHSEKIRTDVEKILTVSQPDILEVQLSLNGLGEDHDAILGVKGGFDRLVQSYKYLDALRKSYRNLKIKVNITYLEENATHIGEIRSWIESRMDLDRFYITFPHGSAGLDENIRHRLREFSETVAEIQYTSRACRKSNWLSIVMGAAKQIYYEELATIAESNVLSYICRAGRDLIVMDCYGDIYPCEVIWEPIGNVRDTDYDPGRIIRNPAAKTFADKRLIEQCRGCTWSCAILNSIVCSPRYYPKLMLRSFQMLASLLGGNRRK